MHLIHCPHCGPRAQTEFRYRIDAEGVPVEWENESPDEAHRRTFYRTNAIGFHRELWWHEAGCRSWLVIERHNRSHAIRSVALAGSEEQA
ncbi:MAG TPA: sarcosine oxidase subunit delta [Woeseiaceae bacterium]|nr:sarcosine oxidase subunit delta [Woeseiaceae bacterium]